jgi:hypothetical protein
MNPRARVQGLVVRRLKDETLVYDLKRHRAHCLGLVTAEVWQACDGARTVAEIAAAVEAATGHVLGEDGVGLALLRLERARLLEGPRLPLPTSPARRAALRLLAVGSGIAVASIVAPTPAQAASCTPSGQCVVMPNTLCTGLPCCENVALHCTKKANGSNCSCN